MIQRIQTIYLFIAVVLCVLAIALPIPYAFSGDTALDIHLNSQEIQALQQIQPTTIVDSILQVRPYILALFSGLVALFSLITIFLFKRGNEKGQIRFCRLSLFFLFLIVVGEVIFTLIDQSSSDLPYYGVLFPICSIIFTWLALRGANAEEKLIPSTIYLLITAVLCIVAIALPIPYAFSGDTALDIHLNSQEIQTLQQIQPTAVVDSILSIRPYTLILFSGLVALLSLITIFIYKKRQRQMRFCRFNLFLLFLLISIGIVFPFMDSAQPDLPYYGALFPIFAFIFIWLSLRGVNADEKLVRSMDRLR